MTRTTKTTRRMVPPVLAIAAALVMLAGRLLPPLREAPIVVWSAALTLLLAALVFAVAVRPHGDGRR
ncbi:MULTISPECIES: hypothetical protein [unclassified Curtobacterium]|uniref:hypothetical protein n=1 Tax=unclassified Curtobacterium TaxID=257496 RepID=UPI000DA156C0|nr:MULTISPECIES: hypothetical protein [unclassified Curtobacterium]PZE87179.1 hypothetical protein DEI91_02500 [Curtobacterium sp. MCBD17_032]WIB15381.1 hypothetical protein DEJ34_14785 [Curtobacterium sp. MCPF17_050]